MQNSCFVEGSVVLACRAGRKEGNISLLFLTEGTSEHSNCCGTSRRAERPGCLLKYLQCDRHGPFDRGQGFNRMVTVDVCADVL